MPLFMVLRLRRGQHVRGDTPPGGRREYSDILSVDFFDRANDKLPGLGRSEFDFGALDEGPPDSLGELRPGIVDCVLNRGQIVVSEIGRHDQLVDLCGSAGSQGFLRVTQ